MIKSYTIDNLKVMDVVTSNYHDRHLKTIRRYIFLSKLRIFYIIPALIGILQLKIARKIGGLEYASSEGQKLIKNHLFQLPKATNKKIIQDHIETQKIHNAIHQHLIKEWKWVADGIALRAFNYNLEILRMLSENETTGSMQFTGKGFQNELLQFKKIAIFGNKLALLSEITNWLRIGDIILFQNNQISIIEIKSSKQVPDERLLRQQKRLVEITNSLNSKSVVTNLGKVGFKNLDLTITSFLKDVEKIIKSVNKGMVCAKYIKFDDVISVAVHNYGRATKKLPKNITKDNLDKGSEILESLLSCDSPNFSETEGVLTLSSYDHFNQREGEFLRLVPPYTVFPFSSKICADLISGKLLITTFVDTNALKRAFEKSGWDVKRIENRKLGLEIEELKTEKRTSKERYKIVKDDTFFVLKKDNKEVHFPFSIIIKMGYEFLSSDFLIKIAEEISDLNMQNGSEYGNLIHFQRQQEIWR